MIHTKLHILLEGLLHRPEPNVKTYARDLAMRLQSVPHFVLDDQLMDAIDPVDVERTIDALLDADAIGLPFEKCLVEKRMTSKSGEDGHIFVLFEAMEGYWNFELHWLAAKALEAKGMDAPGRIRIERCDPLPDPKGDYSPRYRFMIEQSHKSIDAAVVVTLSMLIVLTHTRGVVKEVVTADSLRKLNRSRTAKGKQPVPSYTLYKIGHTYDKDGKKAAWHPGTKMRPHMRAGHVRQQVCGAGRADRRLVFIAPVLVNCAREEELVHKPRVMTW